MGNAALLSAQIDALWDFGNPSESEAKFRERLTSAVGVEALLLHTQVARSLGLQRRFQEAQEVLDAVEEAVPPGDSLVRVRLLLEQGRLLNSSGRRAESVANFEKAYRLSARLREDFYTVDAAHMMGIVCEGDAAIEWNELALDAARQSEDGRARNWRGSLLNNLGWTRHDRGEFEEALALFLEAEEFRREQGKPEPLRIARWTVARCRRSLGQVEVALAMQRELQSELESAGASDGYVQEELGECLLALGDRESAGEHFARAWEILSADPWMAENEAARLERMARLAAVTD